MTNGKTSCWCVHFPLLPLSFPLSLQFAAAMKAHWGLALLVVIWTSADGVCVCTCVCAWMYACVCMCVCMAWCCALCLSLCLCVPWYVKITYDSVCSPHSHKIHLLCPFEFSSFSSHACTLWILFVVRAQSGLDGTLAIVCLWICCMCVSNVCLSEIQLWHHQSWACVLHAVMLRHCSCVLHLSSLH